MRIFDHKNYEKEISKKFQFTRNNHKVELEFKNKKFISHKKKKVYFWHQPAITPKDDDDKKNFPLSITKELQLISMMSELSFSLTRNEGKKEEKKIKNEAFISLRNIINEC